MGLEKFGLEALEHVKLPEEILAPLWKIAGKFEEFTYKSPWKDAITKIANNGNKVKIGQAGAKSVESKSGEWLVSRRLSAVSEAPDGTPYLSYTVNRPSGNSKIYAKINPNGKLSPMRF